MNNLNLIDQTSSVKDDNENINSNINIDHHSTDIDSSEKPDQKLAVQLEELSASSTSNVSPTISDIVYEEHQDKDNDQNNSYAENRTEEMFKSKENSNNGSTTNVEDTIIADSRTDFSLPGLIHNNHTNISNDIIDINLHANTVSDINKEISNHSPSTQLSPNQPTLHLLNKIPEENIPSLTASLSVPAITSNTSFNSIDTKFSTTNTGLSLIPLINNNVSSSSPSSLLASSPSALPSLSSSSPSLSWSSSSYSNSNSSSSSISSSSSNSISSISSLSSSSTAKKQSFLNFLNSVTNKITSSVPSNNRTASPIPNIYTNSTSNSSSSSSLLSSSSTSSSSNMFVGSLLASSIVPSSQPSFPTSTTPLATTTIPTLTSTPTPTPTSTPTPTPTLTQTPTTTPIQNSPTLLNSSSSSSFSSLNSASVVSIDKLGVQVCSDVVFSSSISIRSIDPPSSNLFLHTCKYQAELYPTPTITYNLQWYRTLKSAVELEEQKLFLSQNSNQISPLIDNNHNSKDQFNIKHPVKESDRILLASNQLMYIPTLDDIDYFITVLATPNHSSPSTASLSSSFILECEIGPITLDPSFISSCLTSFSHSSSYSVQLKETPTDQLMNLILRRTSIRIVYVQSGSTAHSFRLSSNTTGLTVKCIGSSGVHLEDTATSRTFTGNCTDGRTRDTLVYLIRLLMIRPDYNIDEEVKNAMEIANKRQKERKYEEKLYQMRDNKQIGSTNKQITNQINKSTSTGSTASPVTNTTLTTTIVKSVSPLQSQPLESDDLSSSANAENNLIEIHFLVPGEYKKLISSSNSFTHLSKSFAQLQCDYSALESQNQTDSNSFASKMSALLIEKERLLSQLDLIQKSHRDLLKRKDDEHTIIMSKITSDLQDKISDIEALRRQVQFLTDNLTQSTSNENKLKNEWNLSKDREKFLDAELKKKEKDVDKEKEDKKKEVEREREEGQRKLDREREMHKKDIATLLTAHTADTQKLQSEHKKSLESLTSNHTTIVAAMKEESNRNQTKFSNVEMSLRKEIELYKKELLKMKEKDGRLDALEMENHRLSRELEERERKEKEKEFSYQNKEKNRGTAGGVGEEKEEIRPLQKIIHSSFASTNNTDHDGIHSHCEKDHSHFSSSTCTSTSTDLNSRDELLKSASAEIELLRSQLVIKDKDLTELTNQIVFAHEQLSSLEEKKNELDSKVGSLSKELIDLKEEKASFDVFKRSFDDREVTLRQQIDELESHKNYMKKKIVTLTQQIEKLIKERAQGKMMAKEQLEAKKEEVEGFKEWKREREEIIQELNQYKSHYQQHILSSNHKNNHITSSTSSLLTMSTPPSLTSQLEHLKSLANSLTEQLADKDIALIHLKKTNVILGQRVRELEERFRHILEKEKM